MSVNFKVMFVFINDRMRTVIPTNISYLSAALKNEGFKTCLFDTSFYTEHDRLMEEQKKEDAGIFKPIDYTTIGLKVKQSSLTEDLIQKINDEKPDLIGFSVFSQAKQLNFNLAEIIKKSFPSILIIFGGIHVIIDPYDVVKRPYVDYICLGEGEEAIVELAHSLHNNKSTEHIKNLGFKKNGDTILNPCRPPQNFDNIPIPDWSIFEPHHIYGPFRGKLLRMAIVEFSRTCPYQCTYCGNKIYKDLYKQFGFNLSYRHKSPQRWIHELKFMKDNFDIEFVNIPDGTFVAQSEKVMKELAPLYVKEINLPFFCDSSVHCLTREKARLLKEMGCVCINMGIECANENYRRKYLDRTMTNEKIINAFLMARNAGIETRAYNIIGLPFETEQDIFQTIELNRECKVGSLSLNIFIPYEGTKLRELCINEKLLDLTKEIKGDGTYPIVKNPYLSDERLLELYNTFTLYVQLPKEVYPVINVAASNTNFSKQLRKELFNLYTQ